jgi:glucose/arabinose dehydrogenase
METMHATRAAILLTFTTVALAACRRSEPTDSAPAPEPVAPASPQAPGAAAPAEPGSPTALQATVAFPALSFELPVFLTHAPGEPAHLYVVEQGGRILRFPSRPDVTAAEVETFLDIRERVRRQHTEEGLLGLAFHPGYAEHGLFYVYYSASRPRRTQLSRLVAPTPGRADPSSERELLRIEQPYGNHNGGWIGFGPEGLLYLSVGDGGAAGDPHGNAQDLGTRLGAMLRLRVGPGIDTYAIPPDNPFVATPGARPEIWAYGLRNAWRCGFDRELGTLWCGDVGQDAIEEIDIVTAGGNYGWNLREGTRPYARGRASGPLVDPIVEYGHDQGVCVTGGYVYRGDRLPGLRGKYLYGDFVAGHVWALDFDGAEARNHATGARVLALASFGEDAEGELYALSLDGKIYRFEPSDPR